MRLRNAKGKKYPKDSLGEDEEKDDNLASDNDNDNDNDGDDGGVTWQPSMEGFLNYLVDSKLVFNTVERIVDESSHVACEWPSLILFFSWQSVMLFLFQTENVFLKVTHFQGKHFLEN